MSIRNAIIDDNQQLKEVKPELEDKRINNRLQEQTEGKADFLILEENSKIVGFVYLKYYGKETHPDYPDIEDLYTKENEREKGYGSILVKECERLVKERGYKKIGLAVNPKHNDSSRKLYERLGFRYIGEKPYIDGVYNGVEDWCIDMEKDLA